MVLIKAAVDSKVYRIVMSNGSSVVLCVGSVMVDGYSSFSHFISTPCSNTAFMVGDMHVHCRWPVCDQATLSLSSLYN